MKTKSKMKFDFVIGNPPYNEVSKSEFHQHKQKGKANLSILFIKKFIEDVSKNGYVCFITPDNFVPKTSRPKHCVHKQF